MPPKKDATICRRLEALRLEEGEICRKGRAMLARKVPDASRRLTKKIPDRYGDAGVDNRRRLVKKVPSCYGNSGIEQAKDRRRIFKRGLEGAKGKGVVEEGKGLEVKEESLKDEDDDLKKNVVDEGEKEEEVTKQEDA